MSLLKVKPLLAACLCTASASAHAAAAAEKIVSFKTLGLFARPGGESTMVLQVKSLVGERLELATSGNFAGWSLTTLTGKVCAVGRLLTPTMNYWWPSQGRLSGQGPVFAGVNAAAFVPVSMQCDFKVGDQVFGNMTFYVKAGTQWVPQTFALEGEAVRLAQ